MQLFEFLLTIVGSAKLVKVSLDNFKLVAITFFHHCLGQKIGSCRSLQVMLEN